MSLLSEMRQGGRGYWLSAPALALYIGLLVLPLDRRASCRERV